MKKRWELLLIGILLLMLVIGFRSATDYRRANATLETIQQRVENEVKSFVKAKESATSDLESLKAEQVKVEAQLKQESRYFPNRYNGIEVSDYILEIFSRSGIDPVLFQPLGVSTENIGKGPYTAYKYQIKGRGTAEQIKNFIADMEKNPYPAYRIDLMDLTFSRSQVEAGFQLIFVADLAK